MTDTVVNLTDHFVTQPTNAQLLSAITGVSRQVTALQTALTQEIKTMSGTLEAQLQALTASLATDMAELSTDLNAIIAKLQPGATVTQADITALTAVKTAADNLVMAAGSAANPPTPPAP